MSFIHRLKKRIGIEVIGLKKRPIYIGEEDRYSYQSKFHSFNIKAGENVLDIGCGSNPFPLATMLVDLYTEKTTHRTEDLKTEGKPFVVADINELPFEDKFYDFVYCSHVLEHVENPVKACSELMRVGKRGYIETPSLMTDVLFSWSKGMHKWFTIVIANRLVFFEYNQRLIEGIKNDYWKNSIFSKRYHPLQRVFYENQDIFNNGFMWEKKFEYTIYWLNGLIESSDSVQLKNNG